MSNTGKNLDDLCIKTIRMLAVDAVEKAKSGHPGMPLGAAPMAYVLWTRFMRFNPKNPTWPDRDRFILSAGHGSALLYALLHLTGYDLSLDDVKNFRQWGSKTPGHPERDLEIGVEVTTGPLGQGFGMGVGMAAAERFLAAQFNKPGLPVMDHYTYAIVSDGDLMEGVTAEAASLAGHLKLGKLIYLYDDNHISIEGTTDIAFTEDRAARFDAYGWHTVKVADGNDLDAIEAGIIEAQAEKERPSLVLIRSNIGFGSPKQDSPSAHGEPLGAEGMKATKEFFDWPLEPTFYIPEEALAQMRKAVDRGEEREGQWRELMSKYRTDFQDAAETLERQFKGELPPGWDEIPVMKPDDGPVATRASSGKVLNAIARNVPNILGGSADLAPSTKTLIAGEGAQEYGNGGGRNFHFGVREHGMGTAVNGMAAHGGLIPYGATFLIFADYMRGSIRLAAIMNVHSIFVFTHDSIALGEDGPTHQPVAVLTSLRAIPNLYVIRPADANETAEAWRVAMTLGKPVTLILTRQKLPILDQECFPSASLLSKGAYVLSDVQGKPDMLLIASGSEVSLALEAQKTLADEKGIKARVVSMPCWELFNDQSEEYRNEVFPKDVKARLSIEAGCSMGWDRWVGDSGDCIAVDGFGTSAPGGEVMRRYGFNVENVVAKAEALIKK